MKKRFLCILLALFIVLSFLPAMSTAADGTPVAVPSKTNFVMDGKPVSITQAYNINGNNYLQLRAIAELLNGTAAQFNVYWDGKYAVIETGKPYNGTATPTALKTTYDVRKSSTSFKLDGTLIRFQNAYLIDGDTNYLQLRELADKLQGTASQFSVYWDAAANQAIIVPGAGFTSIKLGQTELEGGLEGKLFGNCVTPNGRWGFYGTYDKFLTVYYENNCAKFLYTNDLSTYINGGKELSPYNCVK